MNDISTTGTRKIPKFRSAATAAAHISDENIYVWNQCTPLRLIRHNINNNGDISAMFQSLSFNLRASLASLLCHRHCHRRLSSFVILGCFRNFILSFFRFFFFFVRPYKRHITFYCALRNDPIHSGFVFASIGLLRTRIVPRDQQQQTIRQPNKKSQKFIHAWINRLQYTSTYARRNRTISFLFC